jgi:hypothetical protein
VPKFHVYAHAQDCILYMHPTMNQGCGLCDGETSERCWSYLGRFCTITKEMSSGNRVDTLKSATTFYNRRLFDGAAKALVKKVLTIQSRIDQAKIQFDELKGNRSKQQIQELYVEERRQPTGMVLRTSSPVDPATQEASKIDARIYSLVQEILHLQGTKRLPRGYDKTQEYKSSYRTANTNLYARIAERNEKGTPLPKKLDRAACLDLSSWYYHDGRLDDRRAIDALCFLSRTEEEKQQLHSEVLSFKGYLSRRVHYYHDLLADTSDPGSQIVLAERLDHFSTHLQFINRHLQPSQRGSILQLEYEMDSMLAALSVGVHDPDADLYGASENEEEGQGYETETGTGGIDSNTES